MAQSQQQVADNIGSAQKQKTRSARDPIVDYDGMAQVVFRRLQGWLSRMTLKWSVLLNIIFGIIIALMGVALAALSGEQKIEYVYFAQKPDGTITQLQPLSKPIRTDTAVLNWAQRVATECYSFSFSNMERVVSNCEQKYFTKKGAGQYRNALVKAKIFEDVKNLELFHVTSLEDAPVIVDTGKVGKNKNILAYKLKVPVYVRISGPRTKDNTKSVTIYLLVQRVPSVDKPTGLAVKQFIVGRL